MLLFMTTRLIGDFLTPLAPNYAVLCLSRFLVGGSALATFIVGYTMREFVITTVLCFDLGSG